MHFASITKGSLANFSNTILGDVGEPETLKNDLNQGGWLGEDPTLAGNYFNISPKSESDRMGLTTFSQVQATEFPISSERKRFSGKLALKT